MSAAEAVNSALNHRLAGGAHYHHQGCVHNLPPEEQIAMRGKTVEWWMAIVGTMPVQITPEQWVSPNPEETK